MSADVCGVLGSLSNRLISIEENHGSDAHFVLSCLMAQEGYATCLVALHHTVRHYHNVSTKLGASLDQRREKGLLETIEPLNTVTITCDKLKIVKDLLSEITEKLTRLRGNASKYLLVIDDLSDLLNLGITLRDSYSFLHYCHDLLGKFPDLTIAVLTHIIEEDEESRLLGVGLAHLADTRVTVSGLSTGSSKDVSGLMSIHDNTPQFKGHKWGQQHKYHFKLSDRKQPIITEMCFVPDSTVCSGHIANVVKQTRIAGMSTTTSDNCRLVNVWFDEDTGKERTIPEQEIYAQGEVVTIMKGRPKPANNDREELVGINNHKNK